MNCGNGHDPVGLARPSGLYLPSDETDPTALGICKSPVAAGRGSGGFMPELGRQLVHGEAIQVLSEWIASLPGSCD